MSTKLLDGKVAVVTGASRGIGFAICENFISNGARVIACVREVNDTLNEWRHKHAKEGGAVDFVILDLECELSIKSAVKSIRGVSSNVDILVNCAGVAEGAIFQMSSMSKMRSIFEINLFGLIQFTQGVSRLISRNKKQGAIVNISSSSVHLIDSGTMTYSASKAALERVTKSMAYELAPDIRVNAVAPGITETDMASQMDSKARDLLLSRSILKSLAKPSDIANAVLFLSSDMSCHITGQIINVDGGAI